MTELLGIWTKSWEELREALMLNEEWGDAERGCPLHLAFSLNDGRYHLSAACFQTVRPADAEKWADVPSRNSG